MLLTSTHNICFGGEIRKYQYFWIEKRAFWIEKRALTSAMSNQQDHQTVTGKQPRRGSVDLKYKFRKRNSQNIVFLICPWKRIYLLDTHLNYLTRQYWWIPTIYVNTFLSEDTQKDNWQRVQTQIRQSVASDQGLHCLQIVKTFFTWNTVKLALKETCMNFRSH